MVQSARTAPIKRRMHPIGVLTTIAQALRQFLLLFVAAFMGGNSDGTEWFQGGLLVFVVLFGIGRWWRLRYWFEDGAMRVSDGFVMHREIFLDADKVQAVDIRAGLLQRVFDVVRVQIKTGASGTQVDLTALSRSEAERIQRLLDPQGDGEDTAEDVGDSPALGGEAPPALPASDDGPGRWDLSPGELAALGATSGQLGVIGSALAWLFGQAHEQVTAFIETNLERVVGEAGAVASVMGPLVVGTLIVGGLALTWALSIVGTAISWGDFGVKRKRDRVVVARGLLERREVAVQRERIQAITVVEELLMQPLGRCAVYVESIGHAEEKGASTCLHPFLRTADLAAFLDDIAPGLHAAPELVRPPARALPRFLFRPTVFWGGLIAGLGWFWSHWVWWFALAMPLVWLRSWLSWRDTGAGVDGRVVVVRSRSLSRRTAFVPRRCIQTADSSANLFQRRRDLASFKVVAASGNTGRIYTARDLDAEVPERLLDWAGRRASFEATGLTAAPA